MGCELYIFILFKILWSSIKKIYVRKHKLSYKTLDSKKLTKWFLRLHDIYEILNLKHFVLWSSHRIYSNNNYVCMGRWWDDGIAYTKKNSQILEKVCIFLFIKLF